MAPMNIGPLARWEDRGGNAWCLCGNGIGIGDRWELHRGQHASKGPGIDWRGGLAQSVPRTACKLRRTFEGKTAVVTNPASCHHCLHVATGPEVSLDMRSWGCHGRREELLVHVLVVDNKGSLP